MIIDSINGGSNNNENNDIEQNDVSSCCATCLLCCFMVNCVCSQAQHITVAYTSSSKSVVLTSACPHVMALCFSCLDQIKELEAQVAAAISVVEQLNRQMQPLEAERAERARSV